MIFRCNACGWSKTTVPHSDALAEGHTYFKRCPECGKDGLEMSAAGMGDAALATAEDWLRRMQKKYSSR
jgi:hypothetical protein